MDCVEKFEFLDIHIDYTIYIELWKPPKEGVQEEGAQEEGGGVES